MAWCARHPNLSRLFLFKHGLVVTVLATSSCSLETDYVKSGGSSTSEGGAAPEAEAAPSCMNLAAAHERCGPATAEDCCRTFYVPGGAFSRSYDGNSFSDDGFTATVSPFFLDAYEVTVARFRAFVASGQWPSTGDGAHPAVPGTAWQVGHASNLPTSLAAWSDYFANCDPVYRTWSDAPVDDTSEAMPINCVSWFVAHAFCSWDGGRLPSEAEWNFVASGGAEQRVYPWSDPPSSEEVSTEHAVYNCDTVNVCASDEALSIPGSRLPRDSGRWGHADLAGNLVEWVLDAKAWTDGAGMRVPSASYDSPCNDCVALDDLEDNPDAHRVIRGGAFFSMDVTELKASAHSSLPDDFYGPGTGIRCARDM